ncbi:hypothetical protein SRABI102_01589 [Stenotrophomonas lactitubi]|nr:hypothetical protein SRABI81_01332 [Stenotrophomonas lactitubi]CAH0175894.1 hypothetical protein SRABI122_01300 [Stenotrophomonas lactitubi]CAH0194033.1 hypothetical protein SRABI102_01589 [Stenotrophomonas lactitubi]CAH0228527.1 hypothetical protein SRABI66_02628 [Stenotrophomonas lactitubi]
MFNPQTSPDTGNATSSPASPVGPLQLDLLGGPTTASSGPVAPRASRSPLRVKEKPRMTIGTCGPTSFASSVPEGPLQSWENRLRRRLARTGSTECLLTWKQRTTPAGRSLSQLVPSTRPIAGTGSGLWPTPTTCMHKGTSPAALTRKNGASRANDRLDHCVLAQALWPTPTASLADKGVRSTEGAIREAARNHGPDLAAVTVASAMWPTPLTNDALGSGYCYGPKKPDGTRAEFLKLPGAALVASGLPHRGSSATTEKPGALNPAFVCWLMGFLPEWDACAPTAMPSSRKSRRK